MLIFGYFIFHVIKLSAKVGKRQTQVEVLAREPGLMISRLVAKQNIHSILESNTRSNFAFNAFDQKFYRFREQQILVQQTKVKKEQEEYVRKFMLDFELQVNKKREHRKQTQIAPRLEKLEESKLQDHTAFFDLGKSSHVASNLPQAEDSSSEIKNKTISQYSFLNAQQQINLHGEEKLLPSVQATSSRGSDVNVLGGGASREAKPE